jgi:hypothetical protein
MTTINALLSAVRATLTMVAYATISRELLAAKAADYIASRYVATQSWTFDGGEAIVVQTNSIYEAPSFVFLFRIGGEIIRAEGASYMGIDGVLANPPMRIVDALARVRGATFAEAA